MSLKIPKGTVMVYTNTITNAKTDCIVNRDGVKESDKIVPVSLIDKDGKVTYENAWLSMDNLEFKK